MIRWFKSLSAWRLVRDCYSTRYYENTITGERHVVYLTRTKSLHPGAKDWLADNDWLELIEIQALEKSLGIR